MKRSPLLRRKRIVWIFCSFFMVGPSVAGPSAEVSNGEVKAQAMEPAGAPIEERMKFEPILTALVQDHLAKEDRLPGQKATIVARVWYNEEGNAINVDLGKGYLPNHYTITFEERVNAIVDILYYTKKPTEIHRVDVWFDEKDIFEYFPEERGPHEGVAPGGESKIKRRSKRDTGQRKVLIAAGHGVYYNSRYKDWRAQRDPSNQIVEDFVTPMFARRLNRYLVERSGAEVFRARSSEISAHPDSGMPWSSMAARYNIKNVLPEREDIWNSTGGQSGVGMEERDQDIRSRPLYANYLGADVAIHLHTNAHAADSRGIEVFYHEKSPESKRLGDLALCYMRESLRTNAAYADFPIALRSKPKNHGENRMANMPSIIAELGFHTNETDASAIRNSYFQDLTMRGLEKAYRMFTEGNDCQIFAVTYPEVTVISGSMAQVSLAFSGSPRFPVGYESSVAECPSGIICTPIFGRFKDREGPFNVTHGCRSTDPVTIKWSVRFIDADGVTAPAVATMHCRPKS